jgi:hypothetical protein
MTKVYDHADQLSPELVGTVITFKKVTEQTSNPTRTVSLVTAKLINYSTAEGEYTQGNQGVVRAYQILLEGYPTIEVIEDFVATKG